MGLLDLLSAKLREPAECIIRVGAAGEEISDLYPFLVEVSVGYKSGSTGSGNPQL